MSPSFPPEAWLPLSYDGLRPKNLQLFRKLNAVIFPVAYADKFYADCMQAGRVTQLGARGRASSAARCGRRLRSHTHPPQHTRCRRTC